jgi:hypothetical protein
MSEIQSDEMPGIPSFSNGGEQPFLIDSAERANWLVRRIVDARAYGERVRAWAVKEQRRAEREERQLLYLFEAQLERWARQQLAALKSRRKSIHLPAGVIGFRRVRAKLVIEDVEKVLSWARQNYREAVVLKEQLNRAAIKSLMDSTGEIPDDGVRIEPQREALFVR